MSRWIQAGVRSPQRPVFFLLAALLLVARGTAGQPAAAGQPGQEQADDGVHRIRVCDLQYTPERSHVRGDTAAGQCGTTSGTCEAWH